MARRGMLLSFLVMALSPPLATDAIGDPIPQPVPAPAQHPLMVIEQHRASVIQRIVSDWTDSLAMLPTDRKLTPRQLSDALWALRSDRLLAASLAGSYATIESILADDKADRAPVQRVAAKNLGDAGADLTYTPINPCRIADTRAAGGALSANVQRTFDGFNASSFAFQGGTASNCGMPNGVAAIAMNVYAVNPANLGFIKVWPANGAEPAVSTVNYQTGIVAIATGAIVPVDSANSNRFIAKSPAQVDLVADVVGYFKAPGDATGLNILANGQRVMRYEYNAGSPNVIGGHPGNSVAAGIGGAAIGGGGAAGLCLDPVTNLGTRPCANQVTNAYGALGGGFTNIVSGGSATIAGGQTNTASGGGSAVGGGGNNAASAFNTTVAGGFGNTASGLASTVGGGDHNLASGAQSAVGGGSANTASGKYAVVAGGQGNLAIGDYSFAAGTGATADKTQCGVMNFWSSGFIFGCNGQANSMNIAADHGLRVDFGTIPNDHEWVVIGNVVPNQAISASSGAFLSSAGVWVDASSSRTSKTDFAPVDPADVLHHVAALPITTWRYKDGEGGTRHIGPMAEDFWAAFRVGYGERTIADLDARGVALAAIQGLNAKLDRQLAARDAEIAALRDRVALLEAANADENTVLSELAALRRLVEVLMARTSPEGRVAQTRWNEPRYPVARSDLR